MKKFAARVLFGSLRIRRSRDSEDRMENLLNGGNPF
jgi:hypothetical protein